MSSFAKQINKLRSLQRGWLDGLGEPVAEEAIKAIKVLRETNLFDLPDPYLSPTPEGGLQVKWEDSKVTLYIDPNGTVQVTNS